MSEKTIFGQFKNQDIELISKKDINYDNTNHTRFPQVNFEKLYGNFQSAGELVSDVVLKKYLQKLENYEIEPLSESDKTLSKIRMFKVTEMVYQKEENTTLKFASIFNALQSQNCGVFLLMNSDGKKTDFYMGVRAMNSQSSPRSLENMLSSSIRGQFPGSKIESFNETKINETLDFLPQEHIVSVSGIAGFKDTHQTENEDYIQGLEKLATAMQGYKYALVVLSKGISVEELEFIKKSYEQIYTEISPFSELNFSYGKSDAISISQGLSSTLTQGKSDTVTETKGWEEGSTRGVSDTEGKSISQKSMDTKIASSASSIATAATSLALITKHPLMGAIAGAVGIASGFATMALDKTNTDTQTKTVSNTISHSRTQSNSVSKGTTTSTSKGVTNTKGNTQSNSSEMQLTRENKSIKNLMKKIDIQLERIEESEDLGLWENATYVLAEDRYVADLVANNYKALIVGENSGLETIALNHWERGDKKQSKQFSLMQDYVKNLIHPIFRYRNMVPVKATSLVSSKELAIYMGLPRKSVVGLTVNEHASFEKNIMHHSLSVNSEKINIGSLYDYSDTKGASVSLDTENLTKHTFITGSTGSGKSNTTRKIVEEITKKNLAKVLIIEPVKGEYKNQLGNRFSVYGTNPKKTTLLRINPFVFPNQINVFDHIDRLINILNVCWPMYAAMPVLLKNAIIEAYEICGWDVKNSEYLEDEPKIYPSFSDVKLCLENIINSSSYSADTKGDYIGSLVTRISSLVEGLNGLILNTSCISDTELFDNNVIIDLSDTGSPETKSLLMGLLVMKLNEYRIANSKPSNNSLNHVTFLEEAHNLLKNPNSITENTETGLLAKSVELISGSIAELRAYGEGFVIVDQSPTAVDISAIKNTNTKIIMKTPELEDRIVIGKSIGLKDDQIEEIAKFPQGVGVVYQGEWVAPVLVKMDKAENNNHSYFKPEKRFDAEKILLEYLTQSSMANSSKIFDSYQLEEAMTHLSLETSVKNRLLQSFNNYEKTNDIGLSANQISKLVTVIVRNSKYEISFLQSQSLGDQREFEISLEKSVKKRNRIDLATAKKVTKILLQELNGYKIQ